MSESTERAGETLLDLQIVLLVPDREAEAGFVERESSAHVATIAPGGGRAALRAQVDLRELIGKVCDAAVVAGYEAAIAAGHQGQASPQPSGPIELVIPEGGLPIRIVESIKHEPLEIAAVPADIVDAIKEPKPAQFPNRRVDVNRDASGKITNAVVKDL